MQNLVGVRVDRTIGRFDDDRSAYLLGVVRGDDAAERSWDEQIDIKLQKLIARNSVGFAVALQHAVVAESKRQHAGDVETFGAEIRAGVVANRDDLVLRLIHELGRVRADIPKALQSDARLLRLTAQVRKEFEGE